MSDKEDELRKEYQLDTTGYLHWLEKKCVRLGEELIEEAKRRECLLDDYAKQIYKYGVLIEEVVKLREEKV